ncbi:MAG: hypothetical protein JRL30_01095 [Deltaproteobacteria bacterium]|nr:hypothetical protein [Deltaproteobacteria bacterium]
MAASVELITVAELEVYTGVVADSDTGRMTPIVSAVSEAIELYCNRTFLKAELTEHFDAEGASKVNLNRWPVDLTKDVTITESTSVPRDHAGATALATTDYLIDDVKGILERYGSKFPNGIRSLKVVYTGGLGALVANIPAALKMAAKIWCAYVYRKSQEGAEGFASMKVSQYSAEYLMGDIPEDAIGWLAQYKHWEL